MKTCNSLFALTFFCAGFFCANSYADDGINIKPGLWEIQHKTNMNGQQMPDMKDMMANVPPEMREKMKGMMAKNGVGMNDKGMTICLTQEQISRGDLGNQDPGGRCKMVDMKHHGDKTTMTMHCENPAADGKTEVTRISDSEWKSSMHMTTDQGEMNSQSTGKWLGADCGDVKPILKK